MLRPKSKNSLISGVFTLRVSDPGIFAGIGLKDIIRRARCHLQWTVAWRSLFQRFTANPGATGKMPILCLRQSRAWRFFCGVESVRWPLSRQNIFRGRCSRECLVWIFSSYTALFSPFNESYAAVYRFGGAFMLYWEWCLRKWYRAEPWICHSHSVSRVFPEFFYQNFIGIHLKNPEFWFFILSS